MDLSLLSNFFSNVRNDVNGQVPPQLSPIEEQQRQAKLAALKQLMMQQQAAPPAAPQINQQAASQIAKVFQ